MLFRSWTSQKSHSWSCVNSLYEESCPGPVHTHRRDEDGTTRFMSRTELLKNRTMFLIGRIALDMEHWMIWRLHSQIKQMNRAKQTATVHGCSNDCLYLRPVPSEEFATEADVATLAQQVQVVAGLKCTETPRRFTHVQDRKNQT